MKKEYKPFKNIKNVYIDDDYLNFNLNNQEINLEINKGKYIPKSGLLFKNVLNKDLENKKVLDLGCGYLGILSVISYCYNPKQIDSVDIDEDAVNWFKYLIKENNFKEINCFKSDYFQNITSSYDVILANPPQMPMKEGSIHDSGGLDGRKYILEILKDSYYHLNKDGKLYILLFDFLGVTKTFNQEKSIVEIATNMGYKNIKVVSKNKKYLKPNSVTSKNLDYIKDVYYQYKIKRDFKGKYINILILKMEK